MSQKEAAEKHGKAQIHAEKDILNTETKRKELSTNYTNHTNHTIFRL
jgi:hypothetical protein